MPLRAIEPILPTPTNATLIFSFALIFFAFGVEEHPGKNIAAVAAVAACFMNFLLFTMIYSFLFLCVVDEILHVQTAVYRDCLPRDIARFVRRQKRADLCDVADFAGPFKRNVRHRRLHNRGGKNRRHVGVDEPGRDRVYRDVPRRKLPARATS